VLSGPERRRKWPEDLKLAIVAEALTGDAAVSDVARRHDLRPSQLFGWIRRFRDEAMRENKSQMPPSEGPMFAPAVVRVEPLPMPAAVEASASIEISVGTASVRIRGAVDSRTLTAVLKALKVLA
jgi:transposase